MSGPPVRSFTKSCRILPASADIIETMTDDWQLLREYATQNSEEAFGALVRRYLDLVYSTALRHVRRPELAEEVAQSVFIDLARNSPNLKPDMILTAWLYRVTRCASIDVIRRESRRQVRDRVAAEMTAMNSTPSEWSRIEALVDEGLETLDDLDRSAILLRYFENKSLREVGHELGTSDDAAQKRVSRAVDRLREFLATRGVTVGAGGLAVAISANAVQAAPVGLLATISAAVPLAGATFVSTTTTVTAAKAIAMTTLQKAIVTATIAVLAGAGLYEAREASRVEQRVRLLEQQQTLLLDQMRKADSQRADESATSRTLALENERLRRETVELARLRGEIARLRAAGAGSTGDSALESTIRAWADRVAILKQKLEQMPDKRIPEMQFLTEKHWARAAQDADVESEDGVRNALAGLRTIAKTQFAQMIQSALNHYTNANDGLLPSALSQLSPYFATPVDETLLERYQLLQTGKLSDDPSKAVVEEIAPPVDDLHDSKIGITMNGLFTDSFNGIADAIEAAAKAFAAANNGRAPTLPSEITPYLRVSINEADLKEYLNQRSAAVGGVER